MQAEKTVAFNWWNVNPVFCLRSKYGLLEAGNMSSMWRL